MLISSTAWFVVVTLIFGIAFSFARGHAPNLDDIWPWIAAALSPRYLPRSRQKETPRNFQNATIFGALITPRS
ncbi:hypothetical protein CCASEI_10940 [Corynebacterium casei LMG S-19264]|uniref:Uncharacterized protein n=1 Tax=Corynebacterium casei LMG S-19264 TaxID=1285583 RepID=A0ABM5PSH6_9CORY|nr:hypothetical protein CCASEI_10940 [Corynebacterium casei LMG S-19264]HCJ68980.1 hypothetical protein [Corynebacterium casei]